MTKKAKRTAYLIAVHQKREPIRVYAVLTGSAAGALAQVGQLTTDDMRVEVVGSLGRDLVRRIGLMPDEVQLV